MTIEVEVLSETFGILKEYIPPKDRQEAADNLMSVLVDILSDQALHEFGSSDTILRKALKEYGGDLTEFEESDEYED